MARRVMQKISVELQAFMVDNDPSWAKSEFRVVNQRHLEVAPLSEDAPFPVHKWSLDDAALVGRRSIEDRDLLKVFSISLSLQAWLFVHSPVIISRVTTPRFEPEPEVRDATIGMSGYSITVDEDSFNAAAAGLTYALGLGGARGMMFRTSINAYWDAVQSVRTRPRFLNFWAAVEVAVNALGPEVKLRPGKYLDERISKATGISAQAIKPLRELNNRRKHGRASHIHAVEEPAMFVGTESSTLKRLCDKALAERFGFALSPHYDDHLGRNIAVTLPGGNQPAPSGHLEARKLE